ncbi:MAG: response regulator [Acidobacteria bacterium]|nr:response regulator [Acidobacteriota bacterium]
MDSERRILMVDDKTSLCFAMREYFKLYNYQVDCAHNVEDAATLLNTSRYAALIADLDLGGTHNLDGFKAIKMAQEQSPETRVIILTAYGSAEVESAARASGVSAFLHKPTPLSEVAQIIFELVGDNP